MFRLTGMLPLGGLLVMTYLTTREDKAQVRVGCAITDEARKLLEPVKAMQTREPCSGCAISVLGRCGRRNLCRSG